MKIRAEYILGKIQTQTHGFYDEFYIKIRSYSLPQQLLVQFHPKLEGIDARGCVALCCCLLFTFPDNQVHLSNLPLLSRHVFLLI